MKSHGPYSPLISRADREEALEQLSPTPFVPDDDYDCAPIRLNAEQTTEFLASGSGPQPEWLERALARQIDTERTRTNEPHAE